MSVLGLLDSTLEQTGWRTAMEIYDEDSGLYKNKTFVKDKDHYIVYNFADETTSMFYDDEPKSNTVYLQVHIYLPREENYLQIKKNVRELLFNSGFSYPSVSLNTVEVDTDTRHICLETNIESEVI